MFGPNAPSPIWGDEGLRASAQKAIRHQERWSSQYTQGASGVKENKASVPTPLSTGFPQKKEAGHLRVQTSFGGFHQPIRQLHKKF